jgi:uncharacterized protein (TIGR02265 family)
MAVQQVRGTVLRSRLSFVEELAGPQGVRQVLDALPPEHRQAFQMILPIQWYPFALGLQLDEAIVSVLGQGDASFFERLGASSAEKNLGSVHRTFLTKGDAHAFLAKAPQIYRMYYEVGHREYEKSGEREAVLTTHDAETFSAPDCATVVGWYRKALEMCGVPGAMVREEQCRAKGAATCRYRIAWS